MAYREPDRPKPTPEAEAAAASEVELVAHLKRRRRRLTLGIAAGALALIGAFFGPGVVAGISAARAREEAPLEPAIARDIADRLGRVAATVEKSQRAFAQLWPRLRDAEIGARKDLGPCPANMPSPAILEERDTVLLDPFHEGAPASRWLYVDLAPSSMLRDTFRTRSVGPTLDSVTITRTPRVVARGQVMPVLDSAKDAERANDLRQAAARLIRRDQQAVFVNRVDRFLEQALPLDVIVLLDAWQNAVAPAPDPDGVTRGPVTTGYAIARAFAWSATEARVVCASQAVAFHAPAGVQIPAVGAGEYTLLLENLEKELAASWSVSSAGPPRIAAPPLPPPAPTPTPNSFSTHDHLPR